LQLEPPSVSDTAVLITADGIRISDFTIANAAVGVSVSGESDALAVRLSHISLTDIASMGEGVPAAGIILDNAQDAVLFDIDVDGVTGTEGDDAIGVAVRGSREVLLSFLSIANVDAGEGAASEAGPSATGIVVEDSLEVALHAASISRVHAGIGGAAETNIGGQGGVARGIHLRNVTNCNLEHSSAQTIIGGDGGASDSDETPPGAGGLSAGLWLEATQDCDLRSMRFADLTGGERGYLGSADDDPSPRTAQVSYAVWFDRESIRNRWPEVPDILTATAEGLLIFEHVDNQPSGVIQPIIVVVAQFGELFDGLRLDLPINATNWGNIAIFDSRRITLRDITVSNMNGVAGCSGVPCEGGETAAITLESCVDCTVRQVVVSSIAGGEGGIGGGPDADVDGGDGGEVSGILFSGDSDVSADHLLFHGLDGGDGGITTDESGETGAAGLAVCLRATDNAQVSAAHVTCYAERNTPNSSAFTADSVDAALAVTNSIISLDGRCIDEGGDGDLTIDYTVLHRCTTADFSGTGLETGDPSFIDPPNDLRVRCDGDCSSAVDIGAPTSVCDDEPPPNGGRVNAGFYGNTSDATADSNRGTADSFPCP